MMDRQLAAIALQFLQRMSIQGAEVPAFVAVRDALAAIAAGSMVVVPVQAPPVPGPT